LRMTDFEASQNVDFFIANSEEVKARIKKFYRKDAIVIYPPAIKNVEKERAKTKRNVYYLAGGRLARAKGIDVIVEAFKKNKKPLKIFGRGFAGFEEELGDLISESKNIELVGEVTDEEKFELMRNAKAYVFASYDEDFGITPVESMSVGIPVIAYKSGGVKETVVDGKTGIFFDENTAEELNKAILRFERLSFDEKDCFQQAGKFSEDNFKKAILKFVKSKVR
ncbi:glycosyltransferase, partial [Patescibacteria group bacterium]|nr:glycosyltransferase [Patescibacteria group bacterium]